MGKTRTEATRAERKAKKRAAEDQIPDVPAAWTAEPEPEVAKSEKKESKKRKRVRDAEDEESPAVNGEKESKKERKKRKKEEAESEVANEEVNGKLEKKQEKEKREKKEKKSKAIEEPAADVDMADGPGEAEAEPKKSKKERKAERKAKEAADAAANGMKDTAPTATAVVETKDEEKSQGKREADEESKSKKNNRNREKKRKGQATGANGDPVEGHKDEDDNRRPAKFIVFVGNLPFTADVASITKHFASIKPKSVRALSEKGNPTKGRGIAFIEFENYDHMKTCLKLFHHSMFDDGKSAPRQINCELTAGGGGNTNVRKEKIKEKNTKLGEERARRIAEEKGAKLTKQAESGKKNELDESAIHPSRRGRVPV